MPNEDRNPKDEKEAIQDKEIASKDIQAEIDALKAYLSCHNIDNSIKKVCFEANQVMADQPTKPRDK